MFGIDDALIGAGASLLGGLFSKNSSNPNEGLNGVASSYQNQAATFLNPSNPFYTCATQNYYNNLSKTMSGSNPGVSGYLGMMMARGGDFGGSLNMATKAAQTNQTRSNDQASQSANQFETSLYKEGLSAYESLNNNAVQLYGMAAGGAQQQTSSQNSFANNLLGIGSGLLGRYFGQQNQGNNNNNSGNPYNNPYSQWG